MTTKKEEHLQDQMQQLMYGLLKLATRDSFVEFLDWWGISKDDYEKIKEIWKDKLGIIPYV